MATTIHTDFNALQARRFWDKVDLTDDHWLWTGSQDRKGYGQIRIDYKLQYAHRVSYTHFVGPIPDGLELDHLCRTPLCIRPDHLEPVTHAENMRRGKGNGNREKTHCIRGHAFTPETTRRHISGRQCIACKVAYDKARWAARKAAA